MAKEKERRDPLAVRFGRRGGKARAAKMTPEERKELARKAVLARWERYRQAQKSEHPKR